MTNYFKIPFGVVVNGKHVLSICFKNGFSIGIAKTRKKIIHFGFRKD